MATFLITVVVFAAVIAAMAVGVMAGRAPIKGSCGGIGATGIDQSCTICGGDPQRCEEETRGGEASEPPRPQFYDASEKR
ncbi:(Na+)-NQR maturation NqrM [Parahaliea maris]|uniref:(Na+)-NQR maturation NqrM n=1 Tax=Parahaliea maris TaxID=2716870 RepID=A0A5C8ZWP8_9GAMM|nr:(Na+)-NQR maturation NqrM [Parahaliea maris]TXS92993.1 (Na+)-NQR maturation NqrM [Parahaliea maris]